MKRDYTMVAFKMYNLLHDEAEYWYKTLGQDKERFYSDAILLHVRKCINENFDKGYAMVDYVNKKRASRGEITIKGE
jgi:hypothetical protein